MRGPASSAAPADGSRSVMRRSPLEMKASAAPDFFNCIRTAADRQEHKQNKRRFIAFRQMFTYILYSPARTGCESLFSDRSGRPPAACSGSYGVSCWLRNSGMGHRVMAGTVPTIHVIGAPNARKRATRRKLCDCAAASIRDCFCGGIMDGRDKPGHDAPGAQRRDRHRRRPTLKAMTAACYAPDSRHYPPVAFLFNLLFQRMKVLS